MYLLCRGKMARQDTEIDGGAMNPHSPGGYAGVEIPGEKPPSEFSTGERRAAILRVIRDLGHPSMVNQTELAERYGVSQPTIHRDIKALGEDVSGQVDELHDLEVESVFRRSIRGLLNQGEWRKAARTASDYAEWMNDRTEIAELREEVDMLKEVTGTK